MKKFIFFALLACSTSYATVAADASATHKSVVGEKSVLVPNTRNLLSPKRLDTGSFTANGMTFVFVYDSSIPGDFQAALAAAIAYAAWYSHC